MKKIIIFGAGPTGKRAYAFYRELCDVVAYADNNEAIQGTDIGGVPVVSAEQIVNMDYDYIVIASVPGYDSICLQLENYGVAQEKIKKYSSDVNNNRELSFFQYARELRDTSGACAEVGVFQGDTARIINQAFADRKLYLFDTFSGFDERDVETEKKAGFSEAKAGDYRDTSVERVLEKMKYPNQCIIKKGYFPVKTIYLGCKMPMDNREYMYRLARRMGIEVVNMEPYYNEFKLREYYVDIEHYFKEKAYRKQKIINDGKYALLKKDIYEYIKDWR